MVSNDILTKPDDDIDMIQYLNQNETIYADFDFANTEFDVESMPHALPWGLHSSKPEIQGLWESAVAAEISGIDTSIRSDMRDMTRRFDSLPPHLAHLAGTTWQNIISNDIY